MSGEELPKVALPFGETADALHASTKGEDDAEFAFQVLGDHLEEIGQPEFARMIRDRDFAMFEAAVKFLAEVGFDPTRAKLVVLRRRWRGFEKPVRKYLRARTFVDRRGHWSCRIGIYRDRPTPLFSDPFA